MSHFVGGNAALCGLQHSDLRRNKALFGEQVHKCIRMWITIFKMFFWGDVSLYIRSDIIF